MPKTALWPVGLLFTLEAGLLLFAHSIEPLPVNRYTAFITIFILATSWLPAYLRPSPASRVAACYGTLMAGMMLVAFELEGTVPKGIPLLEASFADNLRLINGLFLFPAGYHTVLLFPEQLAKREEWIPPFSRPILFYGVMAALLVAILSLPFTPLRQFLALGMISLAIYLLVATIGVLVRLSRMDDPEQAQSSQRARLILLATLAANLPLMLRPMLMWLAGIEIPFAAVATTQLILPVTFGYAILRHDLYGIDVQVRRTLATTSIYVFIASIYLFLTLLVVNGLISRAPEFSRGLTFLVIVLAAITFRPLYQRIQQFIEQRIYPEYGTFRSAVARVEVKLQEVLNPLTLKDIFETTLPDAIGAKGAHLHFGPAKQRAPTNGWHGQLRLGTQLLGSYWLGPRLSGVPFTNDEKERLTRLLDQLSLALAYARSVDSLNELNQNLEKQVGERTDQLVQQQRSLAVAEERQRLARDLHDSVTQTLFSMGLSIRALARQVKQDPEATIIGLGEQERAAQQALAEMRALLTQLRRPLLAEGDLVQALRVHAALLQQQIGLRVAVVADEPITLPPDIAQELMFVAREALHNCHKHSGVQEACCSICWQDGSLAMRITDRGKGFVAGERSPAGHIGLKTMQERIAALRGQITIESQPGMGTTINVAIPRHWRSDD